MTPDRSFARPGESVTFRITARNLTGKDLENAEVAVTLPLQNVTVSDAGNGKADDSRITWSIPRFPASQQLTFVFRLTLAPSLRDGDLVRTVAAFRSDTLPRPETAQAEVRIGSMAASLPGGSTGVVIPPLRGFGSSSSSSTHSGYTFFLGGSSSSAAGTAVSISLRSDAAERQTGGSVRFTVTVRNASAVPAANVRVQALIPPSLRVTQAGGGTMADGTITWNLASLPAGISRSFAYAATIADGTPEGDAVTSIAQVSLPGMASPLVATTSVRVLARLPQTGDEVRFIAPLEDTSRFLRAAR